MYEYTTLFVICGHIKNLEINVCSKGKYSFILTITKCYETKNFDLFEIPKAIIKYFVWIF